jgi:argininosuccinate lyase
VSENILEDSFYKHLFSVEVVNELVIKGVPFRDAYKQVGLEIEANQFAPDQNQLNHTHQGSIGNLCSAEIEKKMEKAVGEFNFQLIQNNLMDLLR